MRALRKILISFLISAAVFLAYLLLIHRELFSVLEMRLYAPRVVNQVQSDLDSIAGDFDFYCDELTSRFAQYASKSSIRTYLDEDVSTENMLVRSDLLSSLSESLPSFIGLRIIESSGHQIVFSTFESDVEKRIGSRAVYSAYKEEEDIPYVLLEAVDTGSPSIDSRSLASHSKFYLDSKRNAFLFCFPAYDSYATYRGTVIFYMGTEDYLEHVGLMSLSHDYKDVFVISSKGFVFNLPEVARPAVSDDIQHRWNVDVFDMVPLSYRDEKNSALLLLNSYESPRAIISAVYDEGLFLFSSTEESLLLLAMFMTLFIVVFMCSNIKSDPYMDMQRRVRRFQKAFLDEYLSERTNINWSSLASDISVRRDDWIKDIKASLGNYDIKYESMIDSMLDRGWLELMATVEIDSVGVQRVQNEYVIEEEMQGLEELEESDEAEELDVLDSIDEPAFASSEPPVVHVEVPKSAAVEELSPAPSLQSDFEEEGEGLEEEIVPTSEIIESKEVDIDSVLANFTFTVPDYSFLDRVENNS